MDFLLVIGLVVVLLSLVRLARSQSKQLRRKRRDIVEQYRTRLEESHDPDKGTDADQPNESGDSLKRE